MKNSPYSDFAIFICWFFSIKFNSVVVWGKILVVFIKALALATCIISNVFLLTNMRKVYNILMWKMRNLLTFPSFPHKNVILFLSEGKVYTFPAKFKKNLYTFPSECILFPLSVKKISFLQDSLTFLNEIPQKTYNF